MAAVLTTLPLIAMLGICAQPVAAFCENRVVRNYSAPLQGLPPVRRLPGAKGDLPFGPFGLSLVKKSDVQRSQAPIVPANGREAFTVGFGLIFDSPNGKPSRILDWTGVARLVRVSHNRSSQRLVSRAVEHIARLKQGGERRFLFRIQAEAAKYRLEVEFRDRSGRRLGRFGEYLQVLRPTLDARLALNGTTVRPGETVAACLENYGTKSLVYGPGYAIELYDGSTWVPSPIHPPRAVSLIGLRLGPGEASPVGSLAVPGDAPSGTYRWVWAGEVAGGSRENTGPPLTLTSEFQISAMP